MEENIIQRLQKVMEIVGWNQTELAKKINSSKVQVSRWMTGKATPTQNSIWRIAREANCNLDWLLTGRGEMFSPPAWAVTEEEIEGEEEQMEMAEWLEKEERRKTQQQTISQLLAKTAAVLESNTIHHGALASVIDALHRAVKLEEKIPKPPGTGLKALLGKKLE